MAYPLTQFRRFQYLKIVGDHPTPHEIAHRLHFLDTHFPQAKLAAALSWLIKSNLMGTRFAHWVEFELHGSNLELHRELLRRVERDEDKKRAILAGRDFRVANA